MERNHVEYDLGSENVLKELGSATEGNLTAGERTYNLVVIPETMENLDLHTLGLLKEYLGSGGKVLSFQKEIANYSTSFNYKKGGSGDVFIDLGKVGVLATVILNGNEVGTTWMAPYRLKITNAIKEGENTLEIKVANVWRNRITGDKFLQEEEHSTWLLVDNITSEEELIPSGLMGPVTIQMVN